MRGTPGGKFGGALLVEGIEAILDDEVIDVAVDVDEMVVVPVDKEAVLVAEEMTADTPAVELLG